MSTRESFRALGTSWWIDIFDDTDSETRAAATGRCARLADEFEQRYSRFIADSYVSRLNRERTLEDAPGEFVELLRFGQAMHEQTDGACNYLVGHILEGRGYDAQYSLSPASDHAARAPGNPQRDVHLQGTTVGLASGNLDLGSFGKGWLIDELATFLQEECGQHHFLINGGGDMYATSQLDGSPVTIYLEHPTDSTKYLKEIKLHRLGFAASSPFRRRWQTQDGPLTHIVAVAPDGDSLAPTDFATFVTAPTARLADALATAALSLPETALAPLAHRTQTTIYRYDPHTSQLARYI